MKISTVEQMRNLDKSAIENYGISQEFFNGFAILKSQ
jgi:hypothetical protein